MTIEQALIELRKYANDLINIGNAKEYIQTNKQDFLHNWAKVNQYFKYIMNHTNTESEQWWDAIDILADIALDNPSLEEWVNQITKPKSKQVNQQTKPKQVNDGLFDETELVHKIDSYVTEIENIGYLTYDEIGDREWMLQKLKQELISHKIDFDSNVYEVLMSDINRALNKIGLYNEFVESEENDIAIRM